MYKKCTPSSFRRRWRPEDLNPDAAAAPGDGSNNVAVEMRRRIGNRSGIPRCPFSFTIFITIMTILVC
jgi:hypothetical protein